MEAYFSLLRIITILSAHIFLKELTLSVVGKKFNVKKLKLMYRKIIKQNKQRQNQAERNRLISFT